MRSISDVRHALQTHSAGLAKERWNPAVVEAIWNKLVPSRTMPKRATYRKRGLRSQQGGAAYTLQGADLNYAMTPGSAFTTNPAVAVYDRFPIDPTVNPQVVSDLDVYFNSALSRSCGVENTFPTVPVDMGSNKVGGKRKTRNHHMRGGTSLTPGLWDGVKDSGESMVYHPYVGTAYPNTAHSLTFSFQGRESIPASSDPTDHTWKFATDKPLEPIVTTTATALGPSEFLMRSWPTSGAPQPVPPAGGPSGSPSGSPSAGGARRKSLRNRKTIKRRTNRKSRSTRK